ncbi:MAG: helix-turn-helix domain-containing protein [Fastidiosipila sp.]|nr:helix-turn-helix domain-containing protein [Fastidiosipila sp.]
MARTNLKVLRVRNSLSQQEMAERLNCTRATYAAIEVGQRDGSKRFWTSVQDKFMIPDCEMWGLMKVDQERTQNGG